MHSLTKFAGFAAQAAQAGFSVQPGVAGQQENYRLRAEFAIYHEGFNPEDPENKLGGYSVRHCTFDKEAKQRIFWKEYPFSSNLINGCLDLVDRFCETHPGFAKKLFQVEYLTSTTGHLVVSLIFHRGLQDSDDAHAQELRQYLGQELAAKAAAGQTRYDLGTQVAQAVDAAEFSSEHQANFKANHQPTYFQATTLTQEQQASLQTNPVTAPYFTDFRVQPPQVSVILRARKAKRVYGTDYVLDHFYYPVSQVSSQEGATSTSGHYLYQVENSFSQPNGAINRAMLAYVHNHLLSLGDDVLNSDALELYCGVGNFTLVLAKCFKRVVATEINKQAIDFAYRNMAVNGFLTQGDVEAEQARTQETTQETTQDATANQDSKTTAQASDKVKLGRISAEEFVEAMSGVRPFRRLAHIDLPSYNFSTVLVDPPRSGLDNAACDMISAYEHIVYVSCNPETLLPNLQYLRDTHGYEVESLRAFDQFPGTPHLEAVAFLRKTKAPKSA